MDVVRPGNHFPHPRSDIVHDDALLGGEANHVHDVAHVIGLPGQADGDGHRLRRTAVDVDAFALVPVYAHHAVIGPVHLDALSAGVAAFREQFVIHFLANHADFALLGNVGVVQVAPVHELWRLNAGVIGPVAFYYGR